jgi:putative transposase
MRFPRVKAQGQSFYHCVSRFVQDLFVFGTAGSGSSEAEDFLSRMRRQAAFTGVRIVEYVLMADHVHLLCDVPESQTLTESELLQRTEAFHGPQHVGKLQKQLDRCAGQPDGIERRNRLLERYRKRMYDISPFNKELKGGYAQSYNRRHRRYGPVWAERFKSVLLEGGRAVAAIAAYIDLNPVRAGLCRDPKEYRYCGYAEALAKGSASAHEGLRTLPDLPQTTTTSPEAVQSEDRQSLNLKDAASSENKLLVFDPAKGQEAVEQEWNELPLEERLRGKIPPFSDGVILGSRSFVEFHYRRLKQKLGYQRGSGPIALKILGLAELWVFRKPRVRTFG